MVDRRWIPAIMALAALPGCRDMLGPPHPATATVRGRLLLHGRPIGPCFVEFQPIDGTVGDLRSGRVDAGGRFTVTRVPIGRVGIRVVGPTLRTGDPPLDVFLHRIGQSYAIHRDIDAHASNLAPIDLVVEAYRLAAESRRAARGEEP